MILDKEWLNYPFPGATSELLLLDGYETNITVAVFYTMGDSFLVGIHPGKLDLKQHSHQK